MVTTKTWQRLAGNGPAPVCPACKVPLRRETTTLVKRADGRLGLEHERCGEVVWSDQVGEPGPGGGEPPQG